MEQNTLQQHIEARIRGGAGREAIKEQLIAVGWPEEECDRAYAAALVATGVPAPATNVRGIKGASTFDIVLNFFSFILLGMVTIALGTLYFQVVNNYFPDKLLDDPSYYGIYPNGVDVDAIYYAMAALIVAYPMYYLVVRLWFRRFREDEAKAESKLTKWLTYLVLLAASITIVGDLVAVLTTFFQGELTMRFFLKAFIILLIAGMIFGFYFLERKKVQYKQAIPQRTFRTFGYTLTGIVLCGLVLGFVVAGSPSEARMRGFDAERARTLTDLAGCVAAYAEKHERLPEALSDLDRSSEYGFQYCYSYEDPETNVPYEYHVVKPLTLMGGVLEGEVELCAVFSLESKEHEEVGYGLGVRKWFEHGAGRSCDTEEVSVMRYTTPAVPNVIEPM